MTLAHHFHRAGEKPIHYAALDNMMRRHLALLLRGNAIPAALEGVPGHFNTILGRLFNPAAKKDELDIAALADRLTDVGHPMAGILQAIHSQLTGPESSLVRGGLSRYPIYTPTWRSFPNTSRFPGFQAALVNQAVNDPRHLATLESLRNSLPHDLHDGLSNILHSSILGFLRQHNPLAIMGVHDAAHAALNSQNQVASLSAMPALASARHLIGNTVLPHLAAVGRGELQP